MNILLLICVFFPLFTALLIRFGRFIKKVNQLLNFLVVVVTSVLTLFVIFSDFATICPIFSFNEQLKLFLKMDGMGKIFAFLVSILWPFAYLYQMGYFKQEEKTQNYSMFYVMTFGVVLGIAFAGNLITLYVFYELLTLITLPLIVHTMNKEAKRAGRYYLYISLFGSTLALFGIIMLLSNFNIGDFTDGFLVDSKIYQSREKIAYWAYLFMFFGFGVKATIFPLHLWLPKAGIAPTPTTALLHAVAVVKAAAFAIIRMIYSVLGVSILNGSVVHILSFLVVCFTIIFGSTMALKNAHLKRRFAYSTMANISYILLATLTLSKIGLIAALCHFIFHSFAKIVIFFVCGIFNKKANIVYSDQVDGIGKIMPFTCFCLLISGFSIIGIPLFAGFISKWEIIHSLLLQAKWYSYVGIVCLLLSALLTMIYVGDLIFRAYFKTSNIVLINSDKEIKMNIPIIIFSILSLLFGLWAMPIFDILEKII